MLRKALECPSDICAERNKQEAHGKAKLAPSLQLDNSHDSMGLKHLNATL